MRTPRGLEERPTIQQENPIATWTRRTGRLVTAVTPTNGGVELTHAMCKGCCGTWLSPDGTCPSCTMVRRPDPVLGMDDPQYRLDNFGPEDSYTHADVKRDEDLLRRADAAARRRERDARTPVNGCALCGREERGHGERSHHPFRITDRHGFTAPSDRTRLARLRARREMR